VDPKIIDLLVMLSQLLNLLVLIVKCKHVILLLVYVAMQQLYMYLADPPHKKREWLRDATP
jgi:hypothetical protein